MTTQQIKPKRLILDLKYEDAEKIQWALADIACFLRGYNCAVKKHDISDDTFEFFDNQCLNDLNRKLKNGL